VDLGRCATLGLEQARAQLLQLPGVGRKIADCVLLFAYGFEEAFPVDVWILKVLRELYFTKRRPKPARLRRFTESYFGPRAGYVQQYLFHYRRLQIRRPPAVHYERQD
jgi:N-glycosylase/DNA lyase